MDVLPTRRLILLGKTGVGKSSVANTIFGETLFKMSLSTTSQTSGCQAESKLVKGRNITLIETPGFFDMDSSEEDMNPKILKCIVESAPGPHAFVLVLKVERVSDREKDGISKMCQSFSEEALKHTVVLFTHGDQLPDDMKIQEFVSQSEGLKELVKKCGGRCHVIDNKYWNREPQNEYRNNQFQVEQLLNTIDKIVTDNKGGHYTNELLQAVETEIKQEEESVTQTRKACKKDTRGEAKIAVYKNITAKFAPIAGKGLMIIRGLLQPEVAILLCAIKGKMNETPEAAGETPAALTRGKEALTSVAKEATKITASVYLKTMLTGGSGAETGGTVEGEVTGQLGSTDGGLTEEEIQMAAASTEIAAVVQTAQQATMSAAGETVQAEVGDVADGISAVTTTMKDVVDGVAVASEGTAEDVASAAASLIEELPQEGEAVSAIVAVAEAAAEAAAGAAAEICCIQ